MQTPETSRLRPAAAPNFRVMERQRLRPSAVALAVVAAGGALWLVAFGLGHQKARHFAADSASRAAGNSADANDDKDDPSQVDTIVLGDAADAPVPAHRSGHASNVHATILVRLPRFGPQVGLIPDTPTGHLLYAWLGAFNQANAAALDHTLPNAASAVAAQMSLRQQTGGFNLLSAKEIQPGILVFRLRDQTPAGTEALGTLVQRPDSSPPAIASFSLAAVAPDTP